MTKIALVYDDGSRAFLITQKEFTQEITESARMKRKMTVSINKSLAKFFRKIGGEINSDTVGNACADIYLLYQLGDKRVRLAPNYILGTHCPEELEDEHCTLRPIMRFSGEIPEENATEFLKVE